MSWFKEITGKAGALLDKMDQAAATSLQEAGIATPTSREAGLSRLETSRDPRTPSGGGSGGVTGVPYEPTTFQSQSPPSQRGATVAQVLIGSSSGLSQLTTTPRNQPMSPATRTSTSGRSESKSANTDDSIFEFLNAPSAVSGSKKTSTQHRVVPYTPMLSRPSSSRSSNEESRSHQVSPSISMQSEGQSEEVGLQTVPLTSSDKAKVKDAEGDEKERGGGRGETEEVDGEAESPAVLQTMEEPSSKDEQAAEVGGVAKEVAEGAELEEWKQKVSNLELENRLMKREVNALNEELSGVMQRQNETADIKARYESEMQALREQASRADHMIRQLRSHEEDLQASVMARDSQIEVLRNQLAAGDRALAEAKEKLVLSKKEQDR